MKNVLELDLSELHFQINQNKPTTVNMMTDNKNSNQYNKDECVFIGNKILFFNTIQPKYGFLHLYRREIRPRKYLVLIVLFNQLKQCFFAN